MFPKEVIDNIPLFCFDQTRVATFLVFYHTLFCHNLFQIWNCKKINISQSLLSVFQTGNPQNKSLFETSNFELVCRWNHWLKNSMFCVRITMHGYIWCQWECKRSRFREYFVFYCIDWIDRTKDIQNTMTWNVKYLLCVQTCLWKITKRSFELMSGYSRSM